MEDVRTYGGPPFKVAVLHGGPGAAGEMAPVARKLGEYTGVLEPMQTAKTIDGQIRELKERLNVLGEPPCVIAGFSWGAWLGFILAARYPGLVKKLVLISSGPFLAEYAHSIMETRLGRLTQTERQEVLRLGQLLKPGTSGAGDMEKLMQVLVRADAFEPAQEYAGNTFIDLEIYRKVWAQAEKMRQSGKLLCYGHRILCPVVAIHGDLDPHPAQGVSQPLEGVLKDFRFILLKKCGHRPWLEKHARDAFFQVLINELDY